MLTRSLLFLAGMAASAVSSAAIVSYNYTGISLDGGATINGSFGYDDAAVDTYGSVSDYGQYTDSGFWTGEVTGGSQDGTTFNFTSVVYEIFNDDDPLGDTLNGSVPGSDGTTGTSTTYFELSDEDGSVFSDDSLPAILPFDEFEFVRIVLGADIGGTADVEYEFSSVDVAPIPIPAAAWLFGSALVGFISWSRKKQQA
jgi:hypothetical protein